MMQLICKLFARLGSDGLLNGQKQRLFFQAGHSRSLQTLERIFTPLGEVPRGQFVCYFPADARVQALDRLEFMGRCFDIYRAEPIYHRNRVVYIWALCAERSQEAI